MKIGVDVYLKWDGMTDKDKSNQCTGFDVTCGRFGYLRANYGGSSRLKAIELLFDSVKDWDTDWPVDIRILKQNLEKLEKGLFKDNRDDFYRSEKDKDEEIQSYSDFTKLAEQLNSEGKNPKVHFSY
jgi:hypothetical protein